MLSPLRSLLGPGEKVGAVGVAEDPQGSVASTLKLLESGFPSKQGSAW